MVFDAFKEFLTPKHFHVFGYTVAVLYLLIGIVFSAVTIVFIARESENFVCDVRVTTDTPSDKDFVRLQCYEKYKQKYSPFPLFGFALSSFGTMVSVCIAYSFSVKSQIERLETLKPDPEKPRGRPPVKTSRVFKFYSIHLFVRLVLGILFAVLQEYVFYRFGFPMAFDCAGIKIRRPTTNQTVTNSTANPTTSCHSSFQNASWATAIWWINILFAVLVLGELIYLVVQVVKKTEFMHDLNFCKEHLNLFGKTPYPKTRVNSETIYLEPLITNPEGDEQNFELNKIFVDVLIYTLPRRGDQLENRQVHIPDSYLKPRNGAVQMKLEDLFDDTFEVPRKILFTGCPGIGKSVLCKKLLQDSQIKHSFLFEFKYFNDETTKVSLKKLLRDVDSWTFQEMLDNPDKVLLVFDGLDEFKHRSSLKTEYKRAQAGSATEEMSFTALYANLLKGNKNMLPKATILTTCRPSELQGVNVKWFSRTVEIIGFAKEKVEEYITKFCKIHDHAAAAAASDDDDDSADVADKILRHVTANSNLLSLCTIPVICYIICGHLKSRINSQQQQQQFSLPVRLTQVYEDVIKVCIFTRHEDYKGMEFQGTEVLAHHDPLEETLTKLGLLAKSRIEAEREQIFRATEVHGMKNCGLLHRLPDSKISQYTFKENFCFIHDTFHNFLAAREITKLEPSDLSDFITSKASDPKWHLVIQFVAGLLHGQENEAVNSLVNILCDSLTEEPPLSDETKQKALLMMKCLYEYNNETILKKAASELQKNSKFSNTIVLSKCLVTAFDCTAIVHFIKHLNLKVLNLSTNDMTDQSVSFLCDALRDANCELTKLDLSSNQISREGVSHLRDCKFTKLDLGSNQITDEGVCHLCDDKNYCNAPCPINFYCKLTELHLQNNQITNRGAAHLCDALRNENSELTVLNLSYNEIKDPGVKDLCIALKDQNCKLTNLYISGSEITNRGVTHLKEALIHPHCKVKKLKLSQNDITYEGVALLCWALKHPNCQLDKLYLSSISITEQNSETPELVFAETERSIIHLCEALKDEKCELTKLNVSYNKITDQGVSHLCDVLDVNSKLTELDLSYSNITDQGVSGLCDALKKRNCKLAMLNLSGNQITDQGVLHLCDVLRAAKLTKVKLESNRDITDRGFEMLAKTQQNAGLQPGTPSCFVM